MKRVFRSIACGLSVFSLVAMSMASLSAQEVQVENDVQETTEQRTEMTVVAGDGFAAPMIFSTTESFEDGVSGGIRMMSGGTGGFSLMRPGAGDFVMPAPDPFSLLNNPSVQKDLELVGDQLQAVKDLQSEFAKQMQAQLGDLTKGGLGPERFSGIKELMDKLKAEQKVKMEKALLPHQIDRLRQVALQTYMKQAGAENALASEAVAKELGITDEQKDKLKKRAKEVKEQLTKDIEELKEKARDGLLKEVLTPAQSASLKKMVGEKYKPQNKDWEEQFQGMRAGAGARFRARSGGTSRSAAGRK